jgi:hypothetical protein
LLIRAADLKSLAVKTADGAHHAIRELVVEPSGTRLSRVVVDFEGWIERQRAALPLQRFAEPNPVARTWAVDLRAEDLTGRLGAGTWMGGKPMSARLGARVRDAAGLVGRVADLVFRTRDWRGDWLVVALPGSAGRRLVPVAVLAEADWDRAELTLAGPAEAVLSSPLIGDEERLTAPLVRRMQAHYHLPD